MHTALRFMAAFVVLAFLWAHNALALAPPYVSDEELATYPVIVVAKWDKARWTRHEQYSHDDKRVVIKSESYVRLNILDVIKGNVQPGEVDLIVKYGITWNKDGTYVNSGTSTELRGPVNDVTKPCLWFLNRTRSWDESRKEEYLTVSNYLEVQPLELRDFFSAMGDRDAQTQVPKLLAEGRPIVSARVLRYVCGGTWPWPYDIGLEYTRPAKRGKLLRSEAGRVWDFVRSDAKGQRRVAVSVYAELSEEEGLTNMRKLLDDDDPDIRGIAVGILARHRDIASIDRFPAAIEGPTSGWVARQIIQVLSSWGGERIVPTLIGFLQNDSFAYEYHGLQGTPAQKAHRSLWRITGHEFPFDVDQSRKAWEEARELGSKDERKSHLEKVAPGNLAPLVATAIGRATRELSDSLKERVGPLGEDEVVVTIRLRNLSSRPVTILRYPSQVAMKWPNRDSACGDGLVAEHDKHEFVTLQSCDDIEVETKLSKRFFDVEPAKRRLKLCYLADGNRQGVNAWIGTINVEFGSNWNENREVK